MSKLLNFRVSDEQAEQILADAKKAGKNLSEYIRGQLRLEERPPPQKMTPGESAYEKLLRQQRNARR